ncbi:hypothetical protein [Kordia sp.]|uniref:hypothetical protein n=1 Tax=Kordia sp. TaxID=1965332 RepID=UPI003D6B1873
MKKRNLNKKLTLGKNAISNFKIENVRGGRKTDICSGTQNTCANCQGPTREWPCPQN